MQKAWGEVRKNLLYSDKRVAVGFVEGLVEQLRLAAPPEADTSVDAAAQKEKLLNQLGAHVGSVLSAERPAAVALGSLNMIGATKLAPAGVPAVSAVINALKKSREKVVSPTPYTPEEVLTLNRAIDDITNEPSEGEAEKAYRRLVSFGLSTFRALQLVMHSNVPVMVVLRWMERDENWRAMACILDVYLPIIPFEEVDRSLHL